MNTENEKLLFEEVNKRPPNFEIINNLLEKGTNINARDESGRTILLNVLYNLQEMIWQDENGEWANTSEEVMELVQRMVPKIDISIIKYLLEKEQIQILKKMMVIDV